ncbi:hypothetical protein K443DRAFT_11530 [Laccaria amethystina LaAM-08-1]|uniref:Uncharacterized protein n=1 Tax=Laccaria amethystina LaAM-08-1 TaxID=1095629 RepID=A0A0C9WJT2_9AGAR|nr:hypothetical protein K443DRAFT_11530 [Laccaria amethystina LaAM-08-1]
MDPFEGSLNYAQQHQQHTQQVLHDCVLSNIEESPRRRTPIANPHTPTPLPGSAEQARANARSTSRISREVDLQSSPRQRHLSCVQDDENRAPTANGSATSSPPFTFVGYSPDVQREKQTQDRQRMTSERKGTPNARSLGQQRRQERERTLRSMQLATPPSTQGLDAHIVDPQPSVDNHSQAEHTREQLRSPTTPQSSSSSSARSLAQQRRRERETCV